MALALAFLMLMSILAVPAPNVTGAGWLREDIGNTHRILKAVTIGDRDGDGNDEVYVLSTKGHIFVLSFNSVSGSFDMGDVGTAPDSPSNIAMGDVDHDAKEELVVASKLGSSAGKVYIFDHTGSGWSMSEIYSTSGGIWATDVAVGDPDHDGYVDVYIALNNGDIYRLWKGTNWVAQHLAMISSTPQTLAIGIGTGVQPDIYVGCNDNTVYRVKHNVPNWDTTTVGSGDGTGYWNYIRDIAVGDGNKDGSPEVYAVSGDDYVFQFKMSGSTWERTVVDELEDTRNAYSIAIGKADEDDYPELYSVSSNNGVYWYNYTDESVWQRRYVGNAPDDVRAIAIGEADDDSTYKEIYITCDNGHVYRFTRDTEPPENPIVWSPTHEVGVWSNNSVVVVEWKMPSIDPSGIKGYSFTWSANGPAQPDEVADILGDTNTTTSPPLNDGENHYFSIKACDNAGNWNNGATNFGPLLIDTHPPYDMSVSIENGATYTNSLEVDLHLDASDELSGLSDISLSNDGQHWSGWEAFVDTRTGWNLTYLSGGVSDGDVTVYAKFRDIAGNIGGPVSDDITLDTAPPEIMEFYINGGDKYTNQPKVNLEQNASDTDGSGVSHMSFSNDGLLWSNWEPFAIKKDGWDLVSGPGGKDKDAKKSVYIRVRDNAGNIGEKNSEIILDRTPPEDLDIIINSGNLVTSERSVMLTLEAEDPQPDSGISEMSFSEDGGPWSSWEPWSHLKDYTLEEGDGTKTVCFKAKDRAGNEAEQACSYIVLHTSPVVISHVRVLGITDISAVIFWITDTPADGVVRYGKDTNYDGVKYHSTLHSRHMITLSGLSNDTTYHFRIESTDNVNKDPVVTGDMTFTTKSIADTTEPQITNVRVEGITDRSVFVKWKTDEPADSRVRYGTTSDYGMGDGSSRDVLEHTVLIKGLTPGRVYYFSVSSTDPSGNGPAEATGTFTTLQDRDVQKPVITNLKVYGVTDHLAIVSWYTDEPANSIVEYGETLSYGHVAVDENYETVHRVILNDLKSSTDYHLIARSADVTGNGPTTSMDIFFSTGRNPDDSPPVISNVRVEAVTDTTAVVNWATDELADSGVEYWSGTLAGQTNYDMNLVETHTITITDLKPNTKYTFRVFSWDATGNGPTYSDQFSFSTTDEADYDPPMISNTTVEGITNSMAIIMWSTDEPASGLVRFGKTAAVENTAMEEGLISGHSVILLGLESETTYYFIVESTDAFGNGPSKGTLMQFTTLAQADATPPEVLSTRITKITSTTAAITWDTDEPSTSIVKYGKDTGQYTSFAEDKRFLMAHELTLQGLEPNTTYYFVALSRDPSGNEGSYREMYFTTSDASVEPPVEPPVNPPVTPPGPNGDEAEFPWAMLALLVCLVIVATAGSYYYFVHRGGRKRSRRGLPAHVHSEGICPHCKSVIDIHEAKEARRKKAEEEKRKEESKRHKEHTHEIRKARAKRHWDASKPKPEAATAVVVEEVEIDGLESELEEFDDVEVLDEEGYEEVGYGGRAHEGAYETYEEVEEEHTFEEIEEEPEEEVEPEPVPLKTVTCGGCGGKVPVYTTDRPVKIKCPNCQRTGTLKK
jgi:hypothetical protein